MIFISTAHAAEGQTFLESPETWIAFTFFMIVLVVIKPAARGFKAAMVAYGEKVQNKITHAQTLRADTEKLLHDYLKKQKNVEDEIKNIVEDSKKQAETIRKEAEIKLKESLEIREKQVMDNIALLENSAFTEINSKITEVALNAAQSIIEKNLDSEKDSKLVAQFVSEFPETLKKVN